jgi:hypothetical protein
MAARWTDQFAFDTALILEGGGDSLDDLKAKYDVTSDDLLRFKSDSQFRKRVGEYREDIRANGTTFKMKARAQAEDLLLTSWQLIHDPGVSPSVKADLIKSTVKWGGLEPKNDDGNVGPVGGVSITINLGDDRDKPKLVTVDNDREHDHDLLPG